MTALSQPFIGIVLTEKNPVFSPGCKHSVRLVNTFGNKIIYQNTNIRFIPAQDERILFGKFEMCVYTRNNSLCSSFLIAGSSVHLTCKIKILNKFRLKSILKL